MKNTHAMTGVPEASGSWHILSVRFKVNNQFAGGGPMATVLEIGYVRNQGGGAS